jgi:hypothetical protein
MKMDKMEVAASKIDRARRWPDIPAGDKPQAPTKNHRLRK